MPLTTLATSWGYTGENGPAQWGEISKAYATCQTGINQSPIDIQTATTNKLGLPALSIQYVDGPTRFRSINHTLQATISRYTANYINIDDKIYYLKQLDFHAPSEHTLNGRTYPLELQLVHKNQHGDIAIVAVMFDIDEPNQAIQNLWESFPTMTDNSMPIFSPVNINQLLPDDKTYWRYSGSLTTPPCTEGVTWAVLKTPVALSAEQLDKFHYIVGPANNRPLQPLNERKITDSYSGDTEILY
ncbi:MULTISPECIES: carbonic anhydrase [Citrobacter]|nr:carbonic anhydrase family protein [Citrobacter freundii]MCX2456578.1 carbonic anhydrase family protein [Citrobacter freundii complex sp. 2022EL-00972]MCT4726797.1 carbonic anhydrase family protein [Citrobacter freundii]MDE9599711.1 carbonic anhydrase family protein [Citrobacter freundii]MDN4211269.1 carbonic anhydrase family protein [Citrobacter freundii]MDN4215910.1 carbonic anhydrase family protein [Citrobacter freundii]